MSRTGIGPLVERWIAEPRFRAEVSSDLEGTVRRIGVELSEREWALLRRANEWLLADEGSPAEARRAPCVERAG
jgi:hypothetical protein